MTDSTDQWKKEFDDALKQVENSYRTVLKTYESLTDDDKELLEYVSLKRDTFVKTVEEASSKYTTS